MRSASADISEKIVGGIAAEPGAPFGGTAAQTYGRLYDVRARSLGPMRDDRPHVRADRRTPAREPEARSRRAVLGRCRPDRGRARPCWPTSRGSSTAPTSSRHQKQQKIVDRTRAGLGRPGWRGCARARPPACELHGATALVRIPRFGKDYVMPVQEGVSDRVLAEGFGHFKETAQAGPGRQLRSRRPPGHPRRAAAGHAHAASRRRDRGRDQDGDLHLRAGHRPPRAGGHVRRHLGGRQLPENPDGGVEPAQRPGSG